MSEKQPQQNDHRDWHAQQPQQKHVRLQLGWRTCTKNLYKAYQWPVFGIETHGSAGGFGLPFCSSSIECRSGERTNAMLPSRGGRLMVMPIFIRRSQVA